MTHRRTTNANKLPSGRIRQMEKIIDMVRSEKPIERIRSLEQKIDEVDKIEAIESCVELLKDHIWAVKEVLTTAEASAYLGLSESYLLFSFPSSFNSADSSTTTSKTSQFLDATPIYFIS